MKFVTDFRYVDRKTKARYVWLKYQALLSGSILDVGADECHLRQHLPPDTTYWGIGLGGHPDQEVDLEKEGLPFPDGSFDCVVCLDVLEHIDNPHYIFDELCRVSRSHIIISLPNPWGAFWAMLRFGPYSAAQPMKYYGLPPEPPADRHKWFFSVQEARQFVLHRAAKNRVALLQLDYDDGASPQSGWKRQLLRLITKAIVSKRIGDVEMLFAPSLWVVLSKQNVPG